MKKIFLFLFLVSCTSIKSNNLKFNFNDNLSFDQFQRLLTEYAMTTPYPNIN